MSEDVDDSETEREENEGQLKNASRRVEDEMKVNDF